MLNEGWVTKQCSAACEKLPQLATANRYSNCMIVIKGNYFRRQKYKKSRYFHPFSAISSPAAGAIAAKRASECPPGESSAPLYLVLQRRYIIFARK